MQTCRWCKVTTFVITGISVGDEPANKDHSSYKLRKFRITMFIHVGYCSSYNNQCIIQITAYVSWLTYLEIILVFIFKHVVNIFIGTYLLVRYKLYILFSIYTGFHSGYYAVSVCMNLYTRMYSFLEDIIIQYSSVNVL